MQQERLGGLNVRWTGAGEGPTVVLMHGFGAPGTDLVPLHAAIDAPPGTRFVFPEAPQTLPRELGGGPGRMWWMIDPMRIQLGLMSGRPRVLEEEDPPEIASMREQVLTMLDAFQARHGLDRDRLVLGGFSQGAMLATDVVLMSDLTVAGLMVLSGTYLAAQRWSSRLATRAGLPVLQSHGRQDPLLPYAVAERLRDAMTGAGLDVRFVPFAGGHGIGPEVLDEAAGFLRRIDEETRTITR